MKRATKRPSTGLRKLLVVLNSFLAVILALMLGATALAHMFLNKMNRVETPTPEQQISNVTVPDPSGDAQEKPEDLLGMDKDIVNILLIGQDRREGEERARSDAMILVTVNKNTESIVLTSFLRDMYVEIPGHGSNRINASYAWGGMELLNQTLEHNFGIYVDGNVEVDFNQFVEIVDLIGGVEIELREDEARTINEDMGGGNLFGGLQRLNGTQALHYVRIRKLDANGDFSRTQRQRTLLNAMLRQIKDAGPLKLLGIVDDVMPMITTDMSNPQILGMATALLPVLTGAEIVSQRIPADGTYTGVMVDGMSVLKPDLEANRRLLLETLGG